MGLFFFFFLGGLGDRIICFHYLASSALCNQKANKVFDNNNRITLIKLAKLTSTHFLFVCFVLFCFCFLFLFLFYIYIYIYIYISIDFDYFCRVGATFINHYYEPSEWAKKKKKLYIIFSFCFDLPINKNLTT